MHALLALGASHLTRVSPATNYNTAAIVHRGQAIKGLNEALAKGRRDYGDMDAMLATCYALTFQASCMGGDSMGEFITMVRGCALITAQIHKDNSETAFNVGKDNHLRIIGPRLDQLPVLDHSLLTSAILSVQALSPLLGTAVDQELQTAILSVLFALRQSSKAGYLNFIRIYDIFIGMSHSHFNAFIDLNNIPSQLLMAHFVSLQMLMIPLTLHESPERANPSKAKVLLGMVEWGDHIFQRTPATMRPYLEWPRAIMQTVRREVEALDAGTYQSLRLKILDP
jgi:Fungal specific transcription factor domain